MNYNEIEKREIEFEDYLLKKLENENVYTEENVIIFHNEGFMMDLFEGKIEIRNNPYFGLDYLTFKETKHFKYYNNDNKFLECNLLDISKEELVIEVEEIMEYRKKMLTIIKTAFDEAFNESENKASNLNTEKLEIDEEEEYEEI